MSPDRLAAARLPLLERLADAEPRRRQEDPPLRLLDRAGLQASVGRELARLLNSRRALCQPSQSVMASVIGYGVPDWTGLYAANPDDRATIARGVLRTVQAFEPRLREVEVEVAPATNRQDALRLLLRGVLRCDDASWPVAFGFRYGPGGAVLVCEDGI